MSKVKVSHKFPRRAASNIEAVFLFILLVGGSLLVNSLNVGFEGIPFYIALALGVLLTFILIDTDFRRRRRSQLFAEFDPEGTTVHVWMTKGPAQWKGRLSILGNEMDLLNIESASIEEINHNRTLVLREKVSNKQYFIPQRIAVQPEFKDFVFKVIENNKESFTKNFVIVTTGFFNGDTGIIERPIKDGKTVSKPATIAELNEQEEA